MNIDKTHAIHNYSLGLVHVHTNEHVSYVTKSVVLHTGKLRGSIIMLNYLPNKLQTNVNCKCLLLYTEVHRDAVLILSTPLR